MAARRLANVPEGLTGWAKIKWDCEHKRRYDTRKIARVMAQRASSSRGVKVTTYKCIVCRKYHLTTAKPKVEKCEQEIASSAVSPVC